MPTGICQMPFEPTKLSGYSHLISFNHMRKLSIFLISALCLFSSCINEDLSDCGVNYGLEYQVELTTNVQTEIQTELTTEAEVEMGQQLLQALSQFFAKYANDVSMNFYTLSEPQTLRHNEDHYIGGSSASYTIYLPAEDYRHLSVANISGENTVSMTAFEEAAHFNMVQNPGDTIPSHTYGLFSARRDMQVMGDRDQTFHVSLYMQNCAAALVLDPEEVAYKDLKVYLTDLATGFMVNDSIYQYDRVAPVIRTHVLEPTANTRLVCHYGMGFPSKDAPAAQTSQRTDSPQGIWRILVYVTLPDDSVTETTLFLNSPLKAGQLKLIKAYLQPNGAVTPVNAEVGASVELDWKQGGTYEPEM